MRFDGGHGLGVAFTLEFNRMSEVTVAPDEVKFSSMAWLGGGA